MSVNESQDTPPKDANAVYARWRDLLKQQKEHVAECAFLELRAKDKNLVVLGEASGEVFWKNFSMSKLANRIRKRIRDCLKAGRFLDAPLPESISGYIPGQQLIFSPCGSRRSRGLIVISTPTALASHVDSVTPFAGTMAESMVAAIEAATEAGRAQERGQREMAARVAHMSATEVLVAQLRLRTLLKKRIDPKLAREIKGILADLEDAQAGFDRARFIGVSWARWWSQPVEVVKVLAEVGERLNEARPRCKAVVNKRDLLQCHRFGEVRVKASAERLNYAFRDLALCTWLLSEDEPARVELQNGDRTVKVIFSGNAPRLPAPPPQDPDQLEALLCDPSKYFFSPPDFPQARGVSFQLPRDLVREMEGKFLPRIQPDGRLEVTLELPLAGDQT